MKVTRQAKRRWFTPQNHARIRWNTAFSRFTVGVSEAFIEALDVGNKIRDFVQNHLRETFTQAVLRPVIHKIIAAPPIDYPLNFFEIDDTVPEGGLIWPTDGDKPQ